MPNNINKPVSPFLFRSIEKMSFHIAVQSAFALRSASSQSVTRSCCRCYSILASSQKPVINITSVPAPHSGSIRILSLNRPKSRNAINKQLLKELKDQVEILHDEFSIKDGVVREIGS